MKTNVASLREEYRQRSLVSGDVEDDPIRQFELWFDEAVEAGVVEPNAMTLATVGPDGQPSARMVLLKEVSAGGFTFFTNYESRKAQELEEHPHAALVFWWPLLERQVRIEGRVRRVAAQESDIYFARRPRESQLGAWASRQSQVVSDRAELEAQRQQVREQFSGKPIPRPPNWGGYRLVPNAIEFWQGRSGRLHDRLRFKRAADSAWNCHRLAP